MQRCVSEGERGRARRPVPHLRARPAPPRSVQVADARSTSSRSANDIVDKLGDQYSDLRVLFGHENRAVKIPNPMYFLP